MKYMTTVYAFVTESQEAAMHSTRQNLISNASLLRRSVGIGLVRYIRTKGPMPSMWLIPKFYVHQEETKEAKDEAQNDDQVPVPEADAQPKLGREARKKKRNKKRAQRVRSNVNWIGDKVSHIIIYLPSRPVR